MRCDAARLITLGADRGEFAPAQYPPLHRNHDKSDDHKDDGQRSCSVVLRRMAVSEHAIDFIGKDVDAARSTEQVGVLEGFQSANKGQDGYAQDRRQDHRQGNPECRLRRRCAGSRGCFLEGWVHVVEEADQKEVQKRRRAQDGMEEQAIPAINIDDGTARAEKPNKKLVDQPVLWVAEHDPGNGGEDVRNEEGNRDQQLHQAPAWYVGARHCPGKGQGQNETDSRPGRRIDNAIDDNLADSFAAQ